MPSKPAAATFAFVDRAADVGIDFRFHSDMVVDRYFLPEIMGGGVAWLDVDLDGRLDLYVADGGPLKVVPNDDARIASIPPTPNRLYRQLSPRRFAEVTAAAVPSRDDYSQGIAVGDFDVDGLPDMFVGNYGADMLLRNNGDGTFGDVTGPSGVGDDLWSSSSLWADINGDEVLDLFVVNYMDVTPESHKVCHYGGKPGYCGPGSHQGVADRVYLGRGDGTFGCDDAWGFETAPPGKGLAVVAADFDDDLAPEVYVANDMEPNFLFVRAGAGPSARYRETAAASGCAVSGDGLNEASMGIACGDFDGDGRPDLFLTHYYHTKNTLYKNLGGLLFDDQSRRSGVAAASHERLAFGTAAADFDRDGDLDLFSATGHVLGPEQPPFQMEPQVLSNDGVGRFADASVSSGPYFLRKGLGRGVAASDFDGDGDVDLAVSHLDHPLALLVNETEAVGRFVRLQLMSENRIPPVGGRVVIKADAETVTIPLTAGGSYLSSHDDRVFVGLGGARGPVEVEVLWPSGRVSHFDGLEVDAYWRIRESASAAERLTPAGGARVASIRAAGDDT